MTLGILVCGPYRYWHLPYPYDTWNTGLWSLQVLTSTLSLWHLDNWFVVLAGTDIYPIPMTLGQLVCGPYRYWHLPCPYNTWTTGLWSLQVLTSTLSLWHLDNWFVALTGTDIYPVPITLGQLVCGPYRYWHLPYPYDTWTAGWWSLHILTSTLSLYHLENRLLVLAGTDIYPILVTLGQRVGGPYKYCHLPYPYNTWTTDWWSLQPPAECIMWSILKGMWWSLAHCIRW